jgi:hypothetical protein
MHNDQRWLDLVPALFSDFGAREFLPLAERAGR